MATAANAGFWGRLARRVNETLAAAADRNVRFLWVDDILAPSPSPAVGQNLAVTTAFVSEDSGKSFVSYRVLLWFNDAAIAALQTGDWDRLLPPTDKAGWLRINRAGKELEISLYL